MVDLTEIKKLPDDEKWKIIEEIEDSTNGEAGNNKMPDSDYEEKLKQLLNERMADYESGKTKSFTWEEVKSGLKEIRDGVNLQHHE